MSVASEPTVDRLLAMINGFRTTQVIYVVAKLGLADHLANASFTSAELARLVAADPTGLGRVLRLAALFGVVTEDADGRYRLAPLGESLRTDSPGSVRPVAIQLGELHYNGWGALLHSATTGNPGFEHVYSAPLFDYLASHPDAQATFDAYMSANKDPFATPLVEKYDFSRFRRIVDVGAGNGSVSAAILKPNPRLEAIIFDQPQVIGAAEQFLTAAGVRDRCSLVAGNFFDSVPSGGDLYLLSNIIHDWDDERATVILRNCHAVLERNTPLTLLETVLPPYGQPNRAVMADVNMLVMLYGKERTEEEYSSLFRAAGFRLSRAIQITEQLSLIEAFPA